MISDFVKNALFGWIYEVFFEVSETIFEKKESKMRWKFDEKNWGQIRFWISRKGTFWMNFGGLFWSFLRQFLKKRNLKWGANLTKKIISKLISEFQENAHFGIILGSFLKFLETNSKLVRSNEKNARSNDTYAQWCCTSEARTFFKKTLERSKKTKKFRAKKARLEF